MNLKSLLATAIFLLHIVNILSYSNNQAFKCFVEKALPSCNSFLQQCKANESCIAELQNFNHCTFDDSETQGQNLFNGYCFRRWHEKSFQTKKVISCLVDTCDLLYNSEIGVGELYQCMQSLFLEKQPPCEEECLKQMEDKIGMKFNSLPIKDLYKEQYFQGAEAKALVALVAQECITQGGSGKTTVYHEEQIKEQQRPKRQPKQKQEEL